MWWCGDNSRVSQSAFIFTPKHCISFWGGYFLVFSSIHAPLSELSGFFVSLLDAKVRFSLLPSKSSCLGRPTTSFFTFIKWQISHGLHSASFHCVSKICAIISSLLSSFKQTYLRFFTASCVQKFFFHLASLPKEFRIRDPCKRDVYNQNVLSQDLEVFPTPVLSLRISFLRLVLNICGFSAIWAYSKLLLKQPVFQLLWVVRCEETSIFQRYQLRWGFVRL